MDYRFTFAGALALSAEQVGCLLCSYSGITLLSGKCAQRPTEHRKGQRTPRHSAATHGQGVLAKRVINNQLFAV